jgi:tripartite-type tricarboxylate transporter receptor subunit TctC
VPRGSLLRQNYRRQLSWASPACSIGLLAPARTPIAIIKQIAEATHTAVADFAYKQMLLDAGIEPTFESNPEKFRQSLASDVVLWAPVVKALGLKID